MSLTIKCLFVIMCLAIIAHAAGYLTGTGIYVTPFALVIQIGLTGLILAPQTCRLKEVD